MTTNTSTTNEMKKYSIPSFPVSGRFEAQESYAAAIRAQIAKMVEDDDDTYFGVVRCGMGGGYAVDFTENWECHPVELCVFLTKEDATKYRSLADVAAEWPMTAEEMNKASDIENFDCREVPCAYLFETFDAAKNYAAELASTENE